MGTAGFGLATFRADVTPPVGHPLCAGWKEPARAIADPLAARGVILFGGEEPVVLCAVDWCEISNRSHIAWRQALGAAAGTDPDRVAVHTMHPHCTPWPDAEAQELVAQQERLRQVMDPAWCDAALGRVARAVRAARARPVPITHLGLGRALVSKVASNRRVLGADGKIKAVRWTVTKDPDVRGAPEGLIDPYLKTISFWNTDRKVAALHYYTVHPTSYDDDCVVTGDFTGLARDQLNEQEPETLHVYFTECAGNITAGKYNDGARENRAVFTRRIYDALVASERASTRVKADGFTWGVKQVRLPPAGDMVEPSLLAILQDPRRPPVPRIRAALKIAYLRRQAVPIPVSSLHIGEDACVLHLPGESFVEYQQFAQEHCPAEWVAVPAYGDCGPGYICLERSFAEGGYEPTDSFVAPESESVMKAAIRELVSLTGHGSRPSLRRSTPC